MPYAKRKRPTTRKRTAAVPRRKAARRRRPASKRGSTKTTLGPMSGGLQLRDRPQRQSGRMPFARSMFVRLNYADSFGQNAPATNVYGITTWNLNSLFDPDATGAGHQPQQYDQLTAIYRRYHVYGCKVDIEFSNPTADGLFVAWSVRARNTAGIITASIAQLGELPHVKQMPMHNTGSQVKRVSFFVNMRDICHVPKLIYNSDEAQFSAAFNANPLEFIYLEIGTCTTTGVAIGVNVRLRLTYFAKMYNAITAPPS